FKGDAPPVMLLASVAVGNQQSLATDNSPRNRSRSKVTAVCECIPECLIFRCIVALPTSHIVSRRVLPYEATAH
ncbi:MAG: hypothetical protein DWQ08_11540, partial [Proteobacteria bacterium]